MEHSDTDTNTTHCTHSYTDMYSFLFLTLHKFAKMHKNIISVHFGDTIVVASNVWVS